MSHETLTHGRKPATPAIPEASIRLERTGFAITVKGGRSVRVPWDDVVEIRAFKIDLISRDLVCLEIEAGKDGVASKAIQLHEEMPGWYVFIEQLASRLPGCEPHWWAEVTFPAFSANDRVIYRRTQEHAQQKLCVGYP